ncbi:nuclear transport factor 2 family protein [Amycolatopsis taiwanensis]|uniref:SnoaL-like domain-containing protein n=1 Tax=Amycolatopsis taiwanensis TaxID=342230 RepID=A0A9W6R4V4_9PSEU|nr:nuclear transport factor 2 family protein [Amycolatopsis taiwanensis]GLY68653.1 hypothetical protein Atai01_52720 [Amycolatopsis taiwanensis]
MKTSEFVDRFARVWNEKDAETRRTAVAELWASDGHYANVSQQFRGHEEIDGAIREAYHDFVTKGFRFTVHDYHENHDAVRIVWHMVPAAGGTVAAVGTEHIIRDENGRIRSDYQFMDMNPS